MVPITALWLPILLSGVLVFAASSLIHMVFKYHHNDVNSVPREDELMAVMRPFHLSPGDYCVPKAGSMKDMGSEAFKKKWAAGPVVFFTVMPNSHDFMGATFGYWFAYTIVVSTVTAYVTGIAYGPGTDYMHIFRMATTVGFACYAMALPQFSIWYKRNWWTTAKSMFDGLVFGMLTAGALGWLWPK